jgi:alkylation response protein AidB-like acyl-CoA dehydrogenase
VESAVSYSKIRTQFGQVIGSFQAIKHLLANAYVAVESRRRYGWLAVSGVDQGRPDMAECVSISKMMIGEAARDASYAALQVHSGIGYTWECDLHFWLKRIQVLNNWLGTPDEHLHKLANLYATQRQGGLTID